MGQTVTPPIIVIVSSIPVLVRFRLLEGLLLLGSLAFLIASCAETVTDGTPTIAAPAAGETGVDPRELLPPQPLEQVFIGTGIERPTFLTHAGDGSGRIFVMSQLGKVVVFHPEGAIAVNPTVFLDLSDRVVVRSELGMIGLAFDPDFSDNGHLYVHYSVDPPRRGVISRFTVDAGAPSRVDPTTELVLFEIPQPFINHNGGMLAFGPDGFLYIGLGDGGSGGDPFNNAQNPRTLLGSVLRVDVHNSSAESRYEIPHDNPFASGEHGRPEVWAYGLRNPWRFSFDPATGDLWLADVGQNAWEEVNIVTKGGNYGWNVMEADRCYPLNDLSCDQDGLTGPIVYYTHADGCSVIGGYVYRGDRLPELGGTYLYGDFCSGKLLGLRYNGAGVTDHVLLAETELQLSSFGMDESGEVYLLDYRGGGIFRLASE